MKFFPAERLGGAATLRAIAGPYGHTGIRFIPTGGISTSNMKEYLALPNVAALGGSWMTPTAMIRDQDWAGITRLASEARALVEAEER